MMNEQVELNKLIDSPAARRLWLLHRALQSLPIDRAIELARTAYGWACHRSPSRICATGRLIIVNSWQKPAIPIVRTAIPNLVSCSKAEALKQVSHTD